MTTEALQFTFDRDELCAIGDKYASKYRNASPFPHAYIDGLVPDSLVQQAASEFPSSDSTGWTLHVHQNSRKLATADEMLMGPTCRQLIAQLNSSPVIQFLERMSGIDGLVPDPHLFGGGLHQIERGGFLRIHADFNTHPKLKLERRLNLLLYLNPEWDEEWGGHLQLWKPDMSAAEERIACFGGRIAVFSTTSTSYHGHPEPLESPAGVARRSIAMYYYTRDRPEDEKRETHSTLYQEPGKAPAPVAEQVARMQSKRTRVRAQIERWVPPAILEAADRRGNAKR